MSGLSSSNLANIQAKKIFSRQTTFRNPMSQTPFLNQVLAAQFSVVSWCTFRGWSSSFGFLRTVPPSCNTPNLALMKTLMFYLHFLHFSSSQNQRKYLGCYQIFRKANVHQCGNATETYFFGPLGSFWFAFLAHFLWTKRSIRLSLKLGRMGLMQIMLF